MSSFFRKKTKGRISLIFFVDVFRQLVGLNWLYVIILLFYGYS